jgi:hypothetical protein
MTKRLRSDDETHARRDSKIGAAAWLSKPQRVRKAAKRRENHRLEQIHAGALRVNLN